MVTARVASVDGLSDGSVLRNAFHGFVFGLVTSLRSVDFCPGMKVRTLKEEIKK